MAWLSIMNICPLLHASGCPEECWGMAIFFLAGCFFSFILQKDVWGDVMQWEGPHVVLGIQLGLAKCKASILPAVLSSPLQVFMSYKYNMCTVTKSQWAGGSKEIVYSLHATSKFKQPERCCPFTQDVLTPFQLDSYVYTEWWCLLTRKHVSTSLWISPHHTCGNTAIFIALQRHSLSTYLLKCSE